MSKRKQMSDSSSTIPSTDARSAGASGSAVSSSSAKSKSKSVAASSAADAWTTERVRELEQLLDQAVANAQADGALPSAHAWTPFIVSNLLTVRNNATHYTSSVVKNCHAFNHARMQPSQKGDAAQKKSKKKAKKRKVKNEQGETTVVRDEPGGDEEEEDNDQPKPEAASSDSVSTTTATATDPPSTPPADAYAWAVVVGDYLTRLLQTTTTKEGTGDAALLLRKCLKVDVPLPNASVRGGGFIDFTISKSAADADESKMEIDSTSAPSFPSSSSGALLPPLPSASPSDPPLETFTFASIGTISSVFKLKYGTPRQGTIAPASRGTFTLHPSIPVESLEGLEEYSHIWLVFIFHRNANKKFHAKIEPPRALGQKIGVFATRTPHRVNPVGLSLVKLDRVEGRTLHLSALDLIQGTPIIDIKPYHPADCMPLHSIPQWMQTQNAVKPPYTVTMTDEAKEQLQSIVAKNQLEFYRSAEEASAAICESVSLDPRPIYVRERASKEEVYGYRLDRMNVLYRVDDDTKSAQVCAVQYVDYEALMKEEAEEAAAAAGGSGNASSNNKQIPDEEMITKKFLERRAKKNEAAAVPSEPSAASSSK